ncbi:MAG: hypothetical protein WC505_03710 [Patescibacteria group bacterium]
MACFTAPAAAAIAIAGIKKKIPPKYHIEWLTTMLWGGVVMLAVEHVTHGEVVWYPPFLTAMENPADIPVMLKEIATVGGAMTIAIVVAWAVMAVVANNMAKKRETRTHTITA